MSDENPALQLPTMVFNHLKLNYLFNILKIGLRTYEKSIANQEHSRFFFTGFPLDDPKQISLLS